MERFDSDASCDNIIISMQSSRDFFEIVGIFCLSLILFTWGVNSQEVIGFESRFYLFALEMWHYGVNWFPTAYHRLYPDYPSTSTFLIYLTANFLGVMNRLAAVLPSAIAAALTMAMTYLIGALQSKRWGLYAVFFLLLTTLFLKSARSITLDMYITFITASCFYVIYSADVKNNHSREWFIYPLLLLGFAFRGPIGLILPTGVICVYYLLDKNFKHLFFSGVLAFLILLVSTLLLLMVANTYGSNEFEQSVLRMEIIGRMQKSYLPAFFYFKTSIREYAISFPLALMVCVGILYYQQRLHHHTAKLKLLLKLVGWMIIILIGMSIPGDKKIRYILPMMPAVALIASYPMIAPTSERYFSLLRWLLIRLFLITPVILFIALRWILFYANQHFLSFDIHYLLVTQMLFCLFAGGFLAFILFQKRHQWRDGCVLFIATLSFVMSYVMVAEPMMQYLDKTRVFVVKSEEWRRQAHAGLVFYKEQPDGLPIKYLINMPVEGMPVFIDNEKDLLMYRYQAFFVTSEFYFDRLSPAAKLQFREITRNKIGHVPVVIFTNTNRPL
jgi:4-amino-4-deoxy-L-arabinose transferase-like glycosyltransferase